MAWLFLLIRKGNQVLLIIGKKLLSFLSRINVWAFHESLCIKPFRCLSLKVVCFCCLLDNSEASLTNSVDAGQPVPIGAV